MKFSGEKDAPPNYQRIPQQNQRKETALKTGLATKCSPIEDYENLTFPKKKVRNAQKTPALTTIN
jgi:hypothetical protein